MAMRELEVEILRRLNLKEIWDDAYYPHGDGRPVRPLVSDHTYDKNKEWLKDQLEANIDFKEKYWARFTSTSFSRLENSFADVQHKHPMLSLAKTNKAHELHELIRKWRAMGCKTIAIMWKVDGGSSAITYLEKYLSVLKTRHENTIGKDLTVTAYQIENLPKEVSEASEFEVRGEMVIFKDDFEKINADREARKLPLYQNARNAAAGVSQTKDAEKIRELRLSVVAYDVLSEELHFDSHIEKMKWLKAQGFKIVTTYKLDTDITLEDLEAFLEARENERFNLDFEVDGMVFMIDETEVREKFGIKNNVPAYAHAFKFPDVEIEFEIDDSEYPHGIEHCFGATGVITPRAHFKGNPQSLEVLGVSIRHSTLHNYPELARVGWKQGTTHAMVKRAGQVIPKVTETWGAPDNAPLIEPPTVCPKCGGRTGFEGQIFKCLNDECEGKAYNRIMRFIRATQIEEVGPGILEKMVESGLVESIPDLYKVTVDQLSKLDRMGVRSATKIVKNIQASRNVPFWRVLVGFTIPQVGGETAQKIAEKWPTLDDFVDNVNLKDMLKIGQVVGNNVMAYVVRDSFKETAQELIILGVGMTKPIEEIPVEGPLKGITFCLTGSPELNGQKVKKAVVEKLITDNGGKIESMSRTLNCLIAGPDKLAEGSSKLAAAKKNGTKIITADMLVDIVEGKTTFEDTKSV